MPNQSPEVNPQITGAVTQTNVQVLGAAPAMSMGNLFQTMGNSVALAAANSVYAQQQGDLSHQATSTMGVTKLLSEDPE
ncbi:RebB family R body protein [Gimesia aquarii]|uniref:Killing trait n=1 Tax=Gimesia aquarii TaxID=2527964 RepID=A0A517VV25_9PLAN|nr:RebB family R body protein [Gimesia aquarii]QDT96848.1 Killing trait [Gimesia aquarii]